MLSMGGLILWRLRWNFVHLYLRDIVPQINLNGLVHEIAISNVFQHAHNAR